MKILSISIAALLCCPAVVTQTKQENWKKYFCTPVENIAAAHVVHLALHASHQAGHVLAAHMALWNGCKTVSQNYRLAFDPAAQGLYATSTTPVFESSSVNALVTIAGPLLGIIAAVGALKAWHHYYDPQQEKSLKQCILESFKNADTDDSLPAIPAVALSHLGLNASLLLPINHKVFEGYKIAKDLGWIKK